MIDYNSAAWLDIFSRVKDGRKMSFFFVSHVKHHVHFSTGLYVLHLEIVMFVKWITNLRNRIMRGVH